MNYIYDVLLNFSEEDLYDFYEWNDHDYFEYIKKISLIKVSDHDFYEIRDNDIIIDKTFLDKIYETCEVYDEKIIRIIDYACLFSNGKDVFAVEFDQNGKNLMKSGMILDEADEAIEMSEDMKAIPIKYEVIKINKKDCYSTREEKKKQFILKREIDNIYKNKNIDKLKYLYYECFNKTNNHIDNIYHELQTFLDSEWSNTHKDLYELIILSYTKR